MPFPIQLEILYSVMLVDVVIQEYADASARFGIIDLSHSDDVGENGRGRSPEQMEPTHLTITYTLIPVIRMILTTCLDVGLLRL